MMKKNCNDCFHKNVCYAMGRMPERAETCNEYYHISNILQWINFNKEKPKKNGYYFCYHMTSKCGNKEKWQSQILYWEDNLWLYHPSTFKTADYVSHWMPLPNISDIQKGED